MVMRAVICKSDPTSHGGEVLEGNPRATANGHPIALKGHMTRCPQCQGDFPIVDGLGFHSFAGIGTAVEGMTTACGAVLIAKAAKGFMMIDDRSEAEASIVASAAQAVAPNAGSFRAVDERTGKPVPGMPYRIELPDGSVLRGVTDADGCTERVTGHDPATVRLHWESGTAVDGK